VPELANEDSRVYLDLRAVSAGVAPILVDSVARNVHEQIPETGSLFVLYMLGLGG